MFEVVPASKPAVAVNVQRSEPRGEWPPSPPAGAFIPPELPAAVVRAKAKQGAQSALVALNPTDQYLLLVELLADLHAQYGGEPPRNGADVPRSERKPTGLSQPPPALGRVVEEHEEVEEPKPRATRAKACGAPQGRRHQVSLAGLSGFLGSSTQSGRLFFRRPSGQGDFRQLVLSEARFQRRAAPYGCLAM